VRVVNLQPRHLETLVNESGIDPDVIRERGYESATSKAQLRDLGFNKAQQKLSPALLVPLHSVDGNVGGYQIRPDNPRTLRRDVAKYEFRAGSRQLLDVPPRCKGDLDDPEVALWLTEGAKKADALASHGICAINVNGVFGWRGTNPKGGKTALPDWESIALNDRTIYIVFDSDVTTKGSVQAALRRLRKFLISRSAVVQVVYLPDIDGFDKIGVDDFLVARGKEALLDRATTAPEQRRPAPPETRIVDEDSIIVVERPLTTMGGTTVLALPLLVESLIREEEGEDGEIVQLDNPKPVRKRRLHLMVTSADGARLIGPATETDVYKAFTDAEVKISAADLGAIRFRKATLDAYVAGDRPDPLDLYRRVERCVDTFLDLSGAVGDHPGGGLVVTLWILASYWTPSFPLAAYIHFTSAGYGCGKSIGLEVCRDLAYLATFCSTLPTFAAIRETARMGGTLLFDEAEKLNPRDADASVLAIILASNRNGATAVLMEPQGSGKAWKKTDVPVYGPRALASIQGLLPALASRCIVLPMVKSADTSKLHRSPNMLTDWPEEPSEIRADLLLWVCSSLHHAEDAWRYAREQAPVKGRPGEPWFGLLAVAHYLDEHGANGLFDRIADLSLQYQEERQEIARPSLAELAATAIGRLYEGERLVHNVLGYLRFRTADVAREIADDPNWHGDSRPSNGTLGTVLGKMRLAKSCHGGNDRWWEADPDELRAALIGYGVLIGGDQGVRGVQGAQLAREDTPDTPDTSDA